MHRVDLRGAHAEMGRRQGLICSPCAHVPDKLGTLWSVAGRHGGRSLGVAAGYLCQNRYETVTF